MLGTENESNETKQIWNEELKFDRNVRHFIQLITVII